MVTFQLGKLTNQQISGWFQVGRQSREANAVSRSPPTTEKSARALGPSTSGQGGEGGGRGGGGQPRSLAIFLQNVIKWVLQCQQLRSRVTSSHDTHLPLAGI